MAIPSLAELAIGHEHRGYVRAAPRTAAGTRLQKPQDVETRNFAQSGQRISQSLALYEAHLGPRADV